MQETTTTINLPTRLAEQVQTLIQAGWFPDVNALVIEALRRYLESHRLELAEEFIWRDVEWGLHGDD
jgi:Arc/MetJ-type ribon-helix-helix transcriptional regulator